MTAYKKKSLLLTPTPYSSSSPGKVLGKSKIEIQNPNLPWVTARSNLIPHLTSYISHFTSHQSHKEPSNYMESQVTHTWTTLHTKWFFPLDCFWGTVELRLEQAIALYKKIESIINLTRSFWPAAFLQRKIFRRI